MNGPIEVREVTDEEVAKLKEEHQPRGVKLGNRRNPVVARAEANVNTLIGLIRQQGGRRFLLTWEGDKVPDGARVGEYEIAWTQNGQAMSKTQRDIGTYDRLVEFGGASKTQHKMLVYLHPD